MAHSSRSRANFRFTSKRWVYLTIALLMLISNVASAADIYVSPTGQDSNAGTADAPLLSMTAAKEKAREVAGKEPVTVHLADGIYYLPETLVFTPEDSGSEANPVIYKSDNEGGAILSGGAELTLTWETFRDGIFKAQTPEGLSIDQLFIDSTNQRMARYPNYDPRKRLNPIKVSLLTRSRKSEPIVGRILPADTFTRCTSLAGAVTTI